jgi:hypothetical protein
MIKKVISKCSLSQWHKEKDDLQYWLSRTPEERIGAVEFLRKQYYGDSERLQRTVKVYSLSKSELISNKKTLGRKKDLADIEALEKD